METCPAVILCFLKCRDNEIVNPLVNHHGVEITPEKNELRKVLAKFVPSVKEFTLSVGTFVSQFDLGLPCKRAISASEERVKFMSLNDDLSIRFTRFMVQIGNRKLVDKGERILFFQKYLVVMGFVQIPKDVVDVDDNWFRVRQKCCFDSEIAKKFLLLGNPFDDLVSFIARFRLLQLPQRPYFGVVDGIHRLSLMEQLLFDHRYKEEFFNRFPIGEGYWHSFLHSTSNICLWIPPLVGDKKDAIFYDEMVIRFNKVSRNKLYESTQISRSSCVDFFRACTKDVVATRIDNGLTSSCYRIH